jgi:uncharacterized spore protein YtfJ
MDEGGFLVDKMLDSLADRLRAFAESVRIVGEPITHGEKIIIPVISVNTGFAGGGGGGRTEEKGSGNAGGGGAGIRINPEGFLVLTENDVQLLSFSGKTRVESLLDAIPDIIDKVKTIREPGKKEK